MARRRLPEGTIAPGRQAGTGRQKRNQPKHKCEKNFLFHYYYAETCGSGKFVPQITASNLHVFGVKMAARTVALLGNLSIDRKLFDSVASEFELTVDQAATLGALRDMCGSGDVSAVVFDARCLGLSWQDALESVLRSAPRALPVLYAGFAESIPWPELAEAGAFHVLRRPIKESEARHTLGFVWAAKRWDGQQKKPAGKQAQSENSRQPAVNRFVAKG